MIATLLALVLQSTSQIDALVPKGTHPKVIAEGFRFTEGPVWAPEGILIFSDILADTIYKLEIDKPVVLVKPSHRTIGITYDAHKRRIVCQQETRSVVRRELDGSFTTLADKFDGKRLNAPDDVVARSDGNIYFTDPSFALRPEAKEQTFDGVYRISPSGTVTLVSKTFAKPNGLAFSPDEKTLYVNDTVRQQIYAFDVAADGTPSNERLFAFVSGELAGQPNGMKVDRSGNVYCTGPGGIQIFKPSGKYIGLIYLAPVVSNFCFGNNDFKTLYIAAGSTLYEMAVNVAGMPPATNFSQLK